MNYDIFRACATRREIRRLWQPVFNLQASNTELLVRLNLEADTQRLMETGVKRVAHLLNDV